jgi:hypothetical protein
MKLVAIHCINVNWEGTKRFSGDYDIEGDPVMSSVVTVINPGDHFEVPDHKSAERARLLELGAAREMTSAEVELSQLL